MKFNFTPPGITDAILRQQIKESRDIQTAEDLHATLAEIQALRTALDVERSERIEADKRSRRHDVRIAMLGAVVGAAVSAVISAIVTNWPSISKWLIGLLQ